MTASDDEQARVEHELVTLEVSYEMVRLYKDLFGRGPSAARAYFVSQDIVLCVLNSTLVPAERSMRDVGEHQRLRETRLFFQHAREVDFRDAVERITGRRVVAFTSAMDTVADVATEFFLLEPTQPTLVGDNPR